MRDISRSPGLAAALESGEVESHPFIVGELACGTLRRRDEILSLLRSLPRVVEADHDEALTLVDAERLSGRGLGWVDVHLLASAVLSGTTLWTLDKRLAGQAKKLAVFFESSA